jgi:hypothetical protein
MSPLVVLICAIVTFIFARRAGQEKGYTKIGGGKRFVMLKLEI